MVGPKGTWKPRMWCWAATAGHHFGARWSVSCPASWPWEMDVLGPIPVHQILISPGYNNLLIKSWASGPGSESGLCPAKNTESLPELGDFSHAVKSKAHRAATAGKKKKEKKNNFEHSFPRRNFPHQAEACSSRYQLLFITESSRQLSARHLVERDFSCTAAFVKGVLTSQ